MREPHNRPTKPDESARTRADKAARAERLAEEMRRNLKKRKAQQRGKRQPADQR